MVRCCVGPVATYPATRVASVFPSYKVGKEEVFLLLPDLSRKIKRDSVRRVVATQATFEPG